VDFINVKSVRRPPLQRIIFGIPRRLRAGFEILTREYGAHYWRRPEVRHCLGQLRAHQPEYDLVLANDIDCLPIALVIAGKAPVIFDAHEFAPGQFEDRLFFRLFFQAYRSWLCAGFMPAARVVTTVSSSIASAYSQMIGTQPRVIWNAPDPEELTPSPCDGKIRMVHHGLAERSRRLERMIQMMDRLDGRFELNLILVGDDRRYLRRMQQQARGDARIRFLPGVPMRDLPRFINRFDVGLCLLPDSNRQLRWALPNKFFEFVQARLAIAVSPTPEIARLVREHDLGIVGEDFEPESVARQLRTLDTARIDHFKRRSNAAARILSAEPQRERLLAIVAAVLARTYEGGTTDRVSQDRKESAGSTVASDPRLFSEPQLDFAPAYLP
jgi:hypothetical protein